MADPTMQTFCCHRGNATDVALTIMRNLNRDAYNIACIISSTLGILGGLYQVLPRKQYSKNQRFLSLSATRGRNIIVWLAVSDLLASFGVFVRSVIWLKFNNIMPVEEDDSGVIFCTISSALIEYFYTATWIWTFCYALDMQFVLKEKELNLKFYHLAAWLTPLLTTSFGLSVLYIPDANCHMSKSIATIALRILPNYVVTYIPIALIMIYNPFLYCKSTKDMERIITSLSGQFTTKEREILEAVKMKFFLINLVFYVCWTPNLINGVLLWLLWFDIPLTCISVIWYTMALLNPLQAFFNCLVYRRWNKGSEKIVLPWCKSGRKTESQKQTRYQTPSTTASEENEKTYEEILPLLRNVPSRSINNHLT